jgi:glucosamine--fructose-6-phosphate aminotransferase (isomerizing)
MCGIFGYIGFKDCGQLLIEGISLLEYRGYDSVGLTVINSDKFNSYKTTGKVKLLQDAFLKSPSKGAVGISHTRWATHGKPSEANCHPHFGEQNKIALVHNGIIENFREIKDKFISKGAKFKSETDTEVLAFLIEKEFVNCSLAEAVAKAIQQIQGTYAIAVISLKEPNSLVVCKMKSPLLIGIGKNEFFIASDAIPILEHTRKMLYLKDGEIAEVSKEKIIIRNFEGVEVSVQVEECKLNPQQIALDGYAHFMLKEIYEQPTALENAIVGRINSITNRIQLEDEFLTDEIIAKITRIVFVGCGTAWHAGLIGRNIIERIVGVPVQVDYASEFRYRDPLVDKNTLVIAISQSGETADTLGAIAVAKEKGAYTLAIVNAVGSTLTRETDAVIYTRAGPEIGVASTKAFSTQILVVYLLAIYLGQSRKVISEIEITRRINNIKKLPSAVKAVIEKCGKIPLIAEKYKNSKNVIFLGRGTGYPVALEGALKLKEISYIHAEGLHAAELKHGPIALIDAEMPVIVLALKGRRLSKVINNIEEVKARGGQIIAIVSDGDTEIKNYTNDVIEINDDIGILNSIIATIPMQLLSYHFAVARGCNVDQPRNLAKSVTVE